MCTIPRETMVIFGKDTKGPQGKHVKAHIHIQGRRGLEQKGRTEFQSHNQKA